MTIGVDCTFIDTRYVGGLNTYVFGLIDGFLNYAGEQFRITIYVTKENRIGFKKYDAFPFVQLRELEIKQRSPYLKKILQLVALSTPRIFRALRSIALTNEARQIEKEVDLFYTPYLLNHLLLRIPTLSSMHDIQHIHFPHFFPRTERIRRKILFKLTARYSTYLQASSDYIKNDFLGHFRGLEESKLVVIPEGVNLKLFADQMDQGAVRQKYNLNKHFFFYPAQLWKHKNHLTLLKALLELKARGVVTSLVLTGAKMSASDEIFEFVEKNSLSDQVMYLGKVPFDDLRALYKNATGVVVPSLHESSSLPILEAAASGTTIIAAAIPAIKEMATRLDIFLFEPYDYKALADLMEARLNNKLAYEKQINYNLEHISYYSWENAAKLYSDFFTKVLN